MTTTPIAPNLLTYTDTTVTNGTEYSYTIAAVNSVGTGPVSNTESVTPTAAPAQSPPPAVTNLKATVSGTSAVATWTNNGSTATNNETDGQDYYLDGAKVGFGGYPNPAPTTYTFTGLTVGSHTLGVSPFNGATVTEGVPITSVTVTIVTPPTTAVPAGFYTGGSVASVQTLSTTLGISPLQGYSTYCDGTSWSSIAGFTPPTMPSGCILMLGVDLTPNSTGLSAVAANVGTFTTLANNLKAATNAGHTVICRVGWEFDIATGPWGAGVNGNTPTQFAPACTLAINAMKAANPALKFDFCCNSGTSTLAQLEVYYGSNGDAIWDYIGGDHYDNAGGGGNWAQMGACVNLASLHNKPLSCGEWGLAYPSGGVTDPTFIADAAQVFLTPAAASSQYGWPSYTVGYHSYFSFGSATITDYPSSVTQYKTSFG